LNRVFDAIGFVYPDYRYPPWGQKRKGATSGKVAASATPSEPAPKSKKLKVLTHRPRYIEPATVPEFGRKTSLAADPKEPIPPTQKSEEPAIMPKAPSAEQAEAKTGKDKSKEPKNEGTKILEILSPLAEKIVPKIQKGLAATPKRRRMASVLDVLETVKASSSTPGKIAKASKMQIEAKTKLTEVEAAISQASAEAGPSEPAKKKTLGN
jgi:ribosomal protein S25